MRSVNKVIVIGNLTRDPEMRQTPNGQTVTTFGVATNREWVTRNGERKSSAEFHECVAWAKLAEICHKYLKKGRLVYVEGYLKTRSWDTPEGIKKFKTEIVIQDMIMLEKKDSDEDYIPASDSDDDDDEETTMDDNSNTEESSPKFEQEQQANSDEQDSESQSNEESNSTDENPIDKDLGL